MSLVRTSLIVLLAIGCRGKNAGVDDTGPVGGSDTGDSEIDTDAHDSDSQGVIDNDADGYVADVDCNDDDATIHPGADEVWYDGADQDCDGNDDDQDYDGVTAVEVGGDDCDDTDPATNPGAVDACGDALDMDCDGQDPRCGVTGEFDVSDSSGVLLPVSSGDLVHGGVAEAGDFDGDGFTDLLVGAPAADHGGGVRGTLYVVRGPILGPTSLATAAVILDHAGDRDNVGVYVSSGDIDGDGATDFVTAVEGENEGVGMYIHYGPSSGRGNLADGAGCINHGSLGLADENGGVVGDVDGDGFDDVVLGAPRAASNEGVAWLVSGPVVGTVDVGDADATVSGAAGGDSDWLGASIAGADFDGDGHADVAVGIPDADGETSNTGGEVAIFLGPFSGTLTAIDAPARLLGSIAAGEAGTRLSVAGDVDGDARVDLLVGAPHVLTAEENGSVGATYLFVGPWSGAVGLATATARIDGMQGDDEVGSAISGPGDMDGDGYGDVLLGTPCHGGSINGESEVWQCGSLGGLYLFAGPLLGELSIGADATATALGALPGDDVGAAVSAAGDQDRDGFDDAAVTGFDAVWIIPGGVW